MRQMFDTDEVVSDIVKWIQDWFDDFSPQGKAVIGLSDGGDSAVAAALCAKAIGADRVIGVIMPNITQPNIDEMVKFCDSLHIKRYIVPVTAAVGDMLSQLSYADISSSYHTVNALLSRIRLATLYSVAESMNAKVVSTINLSKCYVAGGTVHGDASGDFYLFRGLTGSEIVQIGRAISVPDAILNQLQADSLFEVTDEGYLGLSCEDLDRYIRTGECNSQIVKNKIDRKMLKAVEIWCTPKSYSLREDLYHKFFCRREGVSD